MRRKAGFFGLCAGILGTVILAGCRPAEPPPPTGLLCNLLRVPQTTVITDREPRFSWIVNSRQNGDGQRAYQILAADSETMMHSGQGNVWDSGQVESNQSTAVSYQGSPLKPNSTYYWAVRVWLTKGGSTGYSRAQRFHTGDFEAKRSWPSESRWLEFTDERKTRWGFENRHTIEFHDIPPVKFVKKGEGHYFVDFGREYFGTLKLTVVWPKGIYYEAPPVLEILLGECVNPDDTVNQHPPSEHILFEKHALTMSLETDTYFLKFPRHKSTLPKWATPLPDHVMEVKPFRAVEISGCPGDLKARDVSLHALYYQFDDAAGNFHSSDAVLNQVWDLCKHTLKASTFLGMFTDGNRERMIYEAGCSTEQLGHYALDREFMIQRYTHEFLIYHPTWPTEYSMISLIMAWNDYLFSGDRKSLERYYTDLQAKTLVGLAQPDGLILGQDEDRSHVDNEDFLVKQSPYMTEELRQALHLDQPFRDIVDWPPIPRYRDDFEFRRVNSVVNAYHYNALMLIGKIAEAMGKTADADEYRTRAARLYQTFNEKFFDDSQGLYIDGEGSNHASLHANLYALSFGLVPPERQTKVLAFIRSKGMRCNVDAAQFLLEGLYRHGQADYALSLLTATNDTSWYNMIREGATMTAEAWSTTHTKNMLVSDITFNEIWATAPTNIIANYLMGVRPLEPGFEKILIAPQPATLRQASIDLPTVRGPVHVDFVNEPGTSFTLNLRIPANTTATVVLPRLESEDPMTILDGKRRQGQMEGETIVFENVGSGTHRFERKR